jgi:hypothetical protein
MDDASSRMIRVCACRERPAKLMERAAQETSRLTRMMVPLKVRGMLQ